MWGVSHGVANGAQIADRLLSKPLVSTSDDGDLLTSDPEHFSEHTNEIATILGCRCHKNMVFQKSEEFWSKRPTLNDF